MQQTGDTTQNGPRQPQNKKPKKQVSLFTTIAIAVVVALGAFIAGSRTGDIFAWFGSQNKNLPSSLDFSSVQQVYAQLRDQFDGSLNAQTLIDGAKKGLVAAAGDPYTTYFTNSEANQFLGDLEGKYSGVGAEIGIKNNNLVIISTIDNSPAQKAGLQPNDIIAKVNGQDTTGWSTDKAVGLIKGNKGTTVKLTIVRGQDVKDYSIVRDDITDPSVKSQVTADGIGILRISRFDQGDTSKLTQQAAQDFKQKGVKGIVLDLRGNGGGYLNAAQDVASLWLKSGTTIVQERRGNTVVDTLQANGTAPLNGIPTVVLIDGGSASASEIVAGALHDNKAAQLVGDTSFGKGSVQQIVGVGNGQLKVTIAKWYTPNGKNIDKQGITPDVKVAITAADVNAGKDPQQDKALQLLQQK